MDIQAIVEKITETLKEAPEKVKELLASPAEAIEKMTGHQLSGEDASAVLEKVKEKLAEGGADIKNLVGEAKSKIDLESIEEKGKGVLEEIEEKAGGILGGLFGKKEEKEPSEE